MGTNFRDKTQTKPPKNSCEDVRKMLQVSGDVIYLKGRESAYSFLNIHWWTDPLIHYSFIYCRDKGKIYYLSDIIPASGLSKMNNNYSSQEVYFLLLKEEANEPLKQMFLWPPSTHSMYLLHTIWRETHQVLCMKQGIETSSRKV